MLMFLGALPLRRLTTGFQEYGSRGYRRERGWGGQGKGGVRPHTEVTTRPATKIGCGGCVGGIETVSDRRNIFPVLHAAR